MKASATDVKNNFGKYLKQCWEEDIFISKNDRVIARLSKFEDPSDDYLMVKDGSAAYTYSGRKVTYEEFLKITEDNEERYEFIDGEVFLLSSPGIKHQMVQSDLFLAMSTWFKGKMYRVFAAPFDVTLLGEEIESKNVVQPDILVSCDYNEQRNERDRYTGIPALVVEILSPQTRKRDFAKKTKVYMDGGVSEYWIIDPKGRKVIQYHYIDKETAETVTYHDPDVVKSLHFKGLDISTADIFTE